MTIQSVSTVRLTYRKGKAGPESITGVPQDDCATLTARYLDLHVAHKSVASDIAIMSYRIVGQGSNKRAENGKPMIVHMGDVDKLSVEKPTAVTN